MDNRRENKNISEFQSEIHEWSTRNFGSKVDIKYNTIPILHLMIELGRTSHSVLKLSQGIRGTTDIEKLKKIKQDLAYYHIYPNIGTEPELSTDISAFLGVIEEVGETADAILKEDVNRVVDGIADILVFLLDFCGRNSINAEEMLNDAWNKVKQRDWKKNPDNAHEVCNDVASI